MGRRKRILVVEDEPCCRTVLALILKSNNFDVTEAENGEEALSLLLRKDRGKQPYDLVVTDLQMPRMTGFELIRAIKKETIPVSTFVVTGLEDDDLMAKLGPMGCAGYMEKPCDFDALVERVTAILHETGQSGSPEARG